MVAAKRAVRVLRAHPRWAGPDSIEVDGSRVHVRTATSQISALEALASRREGEYLIILSDRTDSDLGDAVLVATEGRGAESVDEWAAVPELFAASACDPRLTQAGRWAPMALLDHRPPAGWPAAPMGVVTADHALGHLLAVTLRQTAAIRDLATLLGALDSPEGRASWQATSEDVRTGLISWARSGIGPAAAMGLAAAARNRVAVVALGLALDVLWPAEPSPALTPDQGAARGRIEAWIERTPVAPSTARELAAAATSHLLRLDGLDDPAVPHLLTQAEALLTDIGWPAGAERSGVLPSGLTARLRHLAQMLDVRPGAQVAQALPALEGALADVVSFDLAERHRPRVDAARMAVRLVRWLVWRDPLETGLSATLRAALQDYVDDGAWVDRAAAMLWNGDSDEQVARAYRDLFHTVRTRRATLDGHAARLLADATARNEPGPTLIEKVLDDVLRPWATTLRPLVIVLDGMSAPVALELADDLTSTWTEFVPEDAGRRLPILAALPTLTRYSRTAFFAGEVRDGTQSSEKAALKARYQAPVFHKDDLRSQAGDTLAGPVKDAIADPTLPLVAVVLNSIDDALARHDPGGTRWDVTSITHLRHLLDAAAVAGRAVVLTSDHGHVVERGSEARPISQGEARWRAVGSGPVTADEVRLTGARVAGGDVILPWREDLRYASLRSGYHGGASLAEITVPFILLSRQAAVPSGWRVAAPQAPEWWLDRLRETPTTGGRRARRAPVSAGSPPDVVRPRVAAEVADEVLTSHGDRQGMLALDLPTPGQPAGPASGPEGLVASLDASETYQAQRRRAGRHVLPHDEVETILTATLSRGGRAHRDVLAGALGIPSATFPSVLAALSRLLNVEGYPVITPDSDGVTIVVNERLLREQFELGVPDA